jgi:hypothetical protein
MHRLLLLTSCLALAACSVDTSTPQDAKARQAATGAAMAKDVLDHSGGVNSEQSNIQKRLALTMNPGQVGFVMLLNQAGQPIAYYGIKGKLTSSHKRLTAPGQSGHSCYEGKCEDETGLPGDDGVYGDSDNYIFFWDTDGAYHQWSGDYLYSDRPFRTRVEPLVIAVGAAKA